MKTLRPLFALCASTSCAILLSTSLSHAEMDESRKQELLNFLEQDCGSCHGLQRKGGLGSPLVPERLDAIDDDTLVEIILNGIPETAMPPWKEIIAPEEAYFIVKQLRKGIKKK